MAQYLLSVWFDEPYDDLNTPENQRQRLRRASSSPSWNAPTPGCSTPACGRRRRRRWCEPLAATSR